MRWLRIQVAGVTGGHALPRDGPGSAPARDGQLGALPGHVARGDQVAFEAVDARTAGQVPGVIRSAVRDPAQSEEVMQEVLPGVWRSASRYDQARGSATAWLPTLAHRRAVDRVRSQQRSAEQEMRAASPPIPCDHVTEAVEARLDRDHVRRCPGLLTQLQRESLTLAYYGGYTYREVAELLGVSAGTVKTRMRDGLIRLREFLGAQ